MQGTLLDATIVDLCAVNVLKSELLVYNLVII